MKSVLLLSFAVAMLLCDVATASSSLSFSVTTFPKPIRKFEWINTYEAIATSAGQVYGTHDSGKTWTLYNADAIAPATVDPIMDVYMTDAGRFATDYAPQTILLPSRNHTYVADVSTQSITAIAKDSFGDDIQLDNIVFHPTMPERALGLAETTQEVCDRSTGQCSGILMLSTDGLRTWKPIVQAAFLPHQITKLSDYPGNVFSYVFGNRHQPNFDPDVVYYTSSDRMNTNGPNTYQLMAYNIVTKVSTKIATPFVPRVNPFDLIHVEHFTFVANAFYGPRVKMMLTQDNFQTVLSARFPLSADAKTTGNPWMDDFTNGEMSYSILDSSEGVAFINVKHNGKILVEGNTYLSDRTGSRYSLSLVNTRRSPDSGEVDFHKVRSLDGIYVANRVSDNPPKECIQCKSVEDCAINCKAVSYMTRDKGRTWEQLQPPAENVTACLGQPTAPFGSPLTKDQLSKCALHLHGAASDLDDVEALASSPNAVGVIVGSGNIGSQINPKTSMGVNVFMSRDAGRTWRQIAENPHTYVVLDSGAFIILARFDQDTDTIRYTMDSANSWQYIPFVNTKINVETFLRAPGSEGGRKALIQGDKDGKGYLVYVEAVDQRSECNLQSDVESFVPASALETTCLLGRQITYTRRKPGADCFFSPSAPCPTPVRTPCPCTNDDYECDFGYMPVWATDGSGQSLCVPDTQVQKATGSHEPLCFNNTRVTSTKGYYKIAGDRCVGGVDLNPTIVSCDAPPGSGHQHSHSGGHGGLIAFIVILVLSVAIGGLIYYKHPEAVKERVEAWSRLLKGGASKVAALISSSAAYRPMNQADVHIDDEDEDAFRVTDEAPVVNAMVNNARGQEKDNFLSFE
eukprot:PhF_6_TR693/c2_g1_i2/m.1112